MLYSFSIVKSHHLFLVLYLFLPFRVIKVVLGNFILIE